MATRNAYEEYKRDTGFLLYWMIQTFNNIIRAATRRGDGKARAVNTTGELTVAGIVRLAQLIAKHNIIASPVIFRLFRSVIDARTVAHASFLEFSAWNPDPAIENSNRSHRFFIDALTKAVEALGGNYWRDKGRSDMVIEDDDPRAKAQLEPAKGLLIVRNLEPPSGLPTGPLVGLVQSDPRRDED
ncbi:hypothetical protein C8A01DRAFT_34840 [Parachaetomium inaequale]|uniref:DUF6604 domain-containing protein n=1 Tax=Parachaetomium inaequale TaxID=2588326 RepID=A0AAN6ST64_9PEZI|nr:hypothetical protein C8A01DRAFT_34840 [Parachaetomium inaequale]